MLDVWSWATVVQCSWRGAVVQCSWRGGSPTTEEVGQIRQGSTEDVTWPSSWMRDRSSEPRVLLGTCKCGEYSPHSQRWALLLMADLSVRQCIGARCTWRF